jgi:two-component system, chemotaxis family, sensor kinase CheA
MHFSGFRTLRGFSGAPHSARVPRFWIHLLKLSPFHPIKALSARCVGNSNPGQLDEWTQMDELTREFLIESQEGLDRMEQCLTELEARPQDAALLGEIFRSVHTIKGTTGFLGFKRLEKLAHSGENLLGLLREGKLTAGQQLITGLLHLLDGLRSILKSIETEAGEGDGEDTELIAQLEELQIPARANQKQPAQAKVAAHAGSSSPAAAPPPAAPPEQKVLPAQPAPQVPASQPTEPPAVAASDAQAHAPENEHDASKPRVATAAGTAAESTLRVDVVLLNRMMNLVGELVLTRNQVLQATASDPNMTMLSRRLDMVTADLRENVMKARMQPVSNIFSKMPRIVRDLSQSLGRRVRIQVEGQDTELDKSLLEAIKDPLTHAVRNSLDHGIEPPDVRIAAGKDPEGTLKLRASHEGSHVIIEVSDDGAGVAVEKVRKKAIERGLITADRAAQLCERELLELVFLPGFSTAAAVTNVSGRGVGMDVVRTNVEKIGGKVEIDSRVGKGTTLRLRIPLTLAIIPALIVRSLGQSFALPQGALSELVHVPPEQAAKSIEWMEGVPLYRLRGKLLPLVFLGRLLMPGAEQKSATEQDSFIAVLDADGRQYGLVVDGLADPEEIVVKPLSAVLKDIGLYSGATVLGNADLALILDPGSIAAKAGVTMAGDSEVAGAAAEQEENIDGKGLEYLLVEAGGRRAAVPLADVLRIEQIPLSRIEYIGYRPVLNFEGQLMPVEDSSGILAAADADPNAQGNRDNNVVVVVCREGSRHVGIVVSHVLDVAAGGDLFEAGTTQRTGGVTLLRDRVTGVVDLAAVAPLPAGENPQQEWNGMTEKVS